MTEDSLRGPLYVPRPAQFLRRCLCTAGEGGLTCKGSGLMGREHWENQDVPLIHHHLREPQLFRKRVFLRNTTGHHLGDSACFVCMCALYLHRDLSQAR